MLDVVKYDTSGVCMCISFYQYEHKCLKLEIILTEYSLKTFVQYIIFIFYFYWTLLLNQTLCLQKKATIAVQKKTQISTDASFI